MKRAEGPHRVETNNRETRLSDSRAVGGSQNDESGVGYPGRPQSIVGYAPSDPSVLTGYGNECRREGGRGKGVRVVNGPRVLTK